MDAFADLAASRRVRWLARLACLWAAIIVVRLGWLQVVQHEKFRDLAQNQQTRLKQLPASRGTIFDRNGRPLAMSVPVETVTVNPMLLPDRPLAARLLAPVLELDAAELLNRLNTYAANRKGYMVVARRVDAERAGRLRRLGVDWITFEPEAVRRYPNGVMAAHLLGGVDHEEQGNAGVELRYEDELGGFPGYEWVTTDVKRRSYDSEIEQQPRAGESVALTIDRRIQFAADDAVRRAVIENQADSGTAVVMDPHTGEILAMANYPTYDPNEAPRSSADYNARKNLAVTDPFEPGSVFKVFTIAAAIEVGAVQPETTFHCGNGVLNLFGRVIHEAKGGYGVLSVEDILAKSSNIGAIKVGQTIGEKKLYEYLMRFGFNQQTGIDLPSESSGLVFRLKKWIPSSIGSVAIGHEVLATSVQLARGASAIANNGFLVRPRLLREIRAESRIHLTSHNGEEAEDRVRILKPETAITMRRMMERVVLAGTGKAARLDGYSSGGKTGTAQMWDKVAKRYTHRYNSSFLGFAPVTTQPLWSS